MATARKRSPVVTTRTGDDGYTSLLGPERVPKYDHRVESLGALDEATSALGIARAMSEPWLAGMILDIQRRLYLAMTDVAADSSSGPVLGARLGSDDVASVEALIVDLRSRVELKPEFVIPGGTPTSAALDFARTVIRRAERQVARQQLEGHLPNPEVLRYLNRLSDAVFVAARVTEAGTARLAKAGPEEAADGSAGGASAAP